MLGFGSWYDIDSVIGAGILCQNWVVNGLPLTKKKKKKDQYPFVCTKLYYIFKLTPIYTVDKILKWFDTWVRQSIDFKIRSMLFVSFLWGVQCNSKPGYLISIVTFYGCEDLQTYTWNVSLTIRSTICLTFKIFNHLTSIFRCCVMDEFLSLNIIISNGMNATIRLAYFEFLRDRKFRPLPKDLLIGKCSFFRIIWQALI